LKILDTGVWKTRIAEPRQPGFSRWRGDDKARAAVYANRTRLGSRVGKQAMRRRAEIVERSFAHNRPRRACHTGHRHYPRSRLIKAGLQQRAALMSAFKRSGALFRSAAADGGNRRAILRP
jgi:transposase